MSKFKKSLPVILSILISLIIILITSFSGEENESIKEVYNVYLDGKLVGAVNSKSSLEKYIDKEQQELKDEFNVDKVYIPNGIDIEKCVTHNAKILSEKEIYENEISKHFVKETFAERKAKGLWNKKTEEKIVDK